MKAAALSLAGLLFVQPVERPPLKHQGESVPAVVLFAPPEVVDAVCRSLVPNADQTRQILACTNPANSTMLLPDPCLYADGYSQLLCHERAHLRRPDRSQGWVHPQ